MSLLHGRQLLSRCSLGRWYSLWAESWSCPSVKRELGHDQKQMHLLRYHVRAWNTLGQARTTQGRDVILVMIVF